MIPGTYNEPIRAGKYTNKDHPENHLLSDTDWEKNAILKLGILVKDSLRPFVSELNFKHLFELKAPGHRVLKSTKYDGINQWFPEMNYLDSDTEKYLGWAAEIKNVKAKYKTKTMIRCMWEPHDFYVEDLAVVGLAKIKPEDAIKYLSIHHRKDLCSLIIDDAIQKQKKEMSLFQKAFGKDKGLLEVKYVFEQIPEAIDLLNIDRKFIDKRENPYLVIMTLPLHIRPFFKEATDLCNSNYNLKNITNEFLKPVGLEEAVIVGEQRGIPLKTVKEYLDFYQEYEPCAIVKSRQMYGETDSGFPISYDEIDKVIL